MKVTEEEHRRRLELYQKGLSDREIGEKIGCHKETIVYWRRRYGLKTNHPRAHHISREEHERRLRLYNTGLSDAELGRQVGTKGMSITFWRHTYKLKANKIKVPINISRQPTVSSPLINTIRALRLEGKSWVEIAEHVNMKASSCKSVFNRAYSKDPDSFYGRSCIRWDIAVKGLSHRTINLLEKFGACKV